LGLLQLKGIDRALARRKAIDERYRAALENMPGIRCVGTAGESRCNYAYFPILIQPDYPLSRDGLYQKFRDEAIYVRRYFYPLISDFPMYRGLASAAHNNLPVARKIAQQVLCLPIYPELEPEQVDRVLDLLVAAP
jgi:dTDP-4-amino-4,6-dideoxygalactose transaminase